MIYEKTTAPQAERIEFFKFQYSCQTFAQARKILVYIDDERIVGGHPLHHTLWTSFMVLYGKPFKQQKPLRLNAIIVPAEFKSLHDDLLVYRDKMYAHTDLDLVEEHSLDPLNSVVVTITDGKVQMGNGFIYPRAETIAKYRSLVEALIKKTNYHAVKLWKSWDVIAKRNGRYVINIGGASDDVLRKINWEADTDLITDSTEI